MNREYPSRPFVGIGAVIVEDGRVVLVRRRQPPSAGQWSLPGGAVELGETLEQAVTREILEETGLHVRVGPVAEVLDRITRDAAGQVQYHYVLVDYLCWPESGTLVAGSDVGDAIWAHAAELDQYGLTDAALSVIERALRLAATGNDAVVSQECGPGRASAREQYGLESARTEPRSPSGV